MKQILIISGKGGTGKTVLTGAFAALAGNKIMVDCDVDAANLHILLSPEIKERHEFRSGKTAFIDKQRCNRCGKCAEVCRFDAINEDFVVDPVSCEGCGFCSFVCPVNAIEMRENVSGEWFISDTRFGSFVHAKLGVAEENSGKLVSLIKQKAKGLAEQQNCDWVIIDGAPGIGCPVIASLSGVDCAVVVTEPTLSGLHDARRVMEVARHFNVRTKMVINKYDLNLDMARQIEDFCARNAVAVIGRIRFDISVINAMVAGKTIMEYPESETSAAIHAMWESLEATAG